MRVPRRHFRIQPRQRPLLVWIFLFGNAVQACSESSTESSPVSASDSAGIRIVEFSNLRDLATDSWRTQSLYSTEDLKIPLHEVQAAVFLQDGSLLISNSSSGELILLDPSGRLAGTIGGKGEGPGEYEYVLWLGNGLKGSVIVYDAGHMRLTELDPSWEVIRTHNLHTSVPLGIVVSRTQRAPDGRLRLLE